MILSARRSAWGKAACRFLHCIWIQFSLQEIKRPIPFHKEKKKNISWLLQKAERIYHVSHQREAAVIGKQIRSQKIQVQMLLYHSPMVHPMTSPLWAQHPYIADGNGNNAYTVRRYQI